ncbi:MAG TPA: biotin/lipoyl-binding protein, partial [Pyrinomonadaceae bacterium]|nr:biotin/lipoyl-binding protein [Pyrinomonadaceae bacterium]
MSVKEATTTKQTTAVQPSKPPAEPAVPAKDENHTAATPKEVTPRTTEVTKASKPSWISRLSFKQVVPVVILLLAAGILVGITSGWNWFVGSRGKQKTDDAILRADITPLSTRVSGTVAQVFVSDYQRVKAGDLLVQLKDEDFKAQVAQAEAGVAAAEAALETNAKQKELQASRIAQAQAGTHAASAEIAQAGAGIEGANADVADAQAAIEVAQAKIPDAQAGVDAAQADAERTLLERKRQEALVELGSATKQKLEQAVADQQRYAAILDSRKAELAQARALLESRRAELLKTRAQVT